MSCKVEQKQNKNSVHEDGSMQVTGLGNGQG
jgi:hypothetical protein